MQGRRGKGPDRAVLTHQQDHLAEKLEKVVKPPQKPVMMSSFHSGATWLFNANHATAMPTI